jgi:hypothetical protein
MSDMFDGKYPVLKTEGPDDSKADPQKIASFLDTLLTVGLLKTVKYPGHLQKSYALLDEKDKKEWYEHTFEDLFSTAGTKAAGKTGRALNGTEQDILEQKLHEFLKQNVLEQ